MAERFVLKKEVENATEYNAILKDPEKWVPSSLLSFDDNKTKLKIMKLVAIEYGPDEKDVYVAFICSDKRSGYQCQLPVTYVRKVFSGRSESGEIIAGKCTGSFVQTLENSNFSWDTVNDLKGRTLDVSRPTKINVEKNGKLITHRVYRLDLVDE